MGADHEAHRQRLAGCRVGLVDRAQIARRNQIDAGLAPPAQHQPAHAHIGEARARIDDEIDRGRDVGPAVGAVAEVDRELGEVGLVAGEHHLLHGRLRPRHLEHLRLVAQPALDFRHQRARLDAEGERQPGAAAGDVGNQFLPLRTDRLEHHGAGIAFEDRRHIGEIERLAVDFAFAVRKAFDKPPQPEPIKVHSRRWGCCRRFFDDVHAADYTGRPILAKA